MTTRTKPSKPPGCRSSALDEKRLLRFAWEAVVGARIFKAVSPKGLGLLPDQAKGAVVLDHDRCHRRRSNLAGASSIDGGASEDDTPAPLAVD
jgi:hypothetical protein